MMNIIYKYYFILFCISYGLICCLLLFSHGFLLSRNIIPAKSKCDSLLHDNINNLGQMNDNFSQHCVKSDTKVILIVIDALRYDFMRSMKNDKYYYNNFKNVHRLLENKQRSRLLSFIADPPTTTMQRLHGMMTGSLPTFIDVGSNFASTEIIEDNLLYQLNMSGKNIVFLGDDTWTNLFPNYFLRSYPFPSFDVWDLDTVDIGVTSNIYSEIRKSDWDLLIAHYLGVDHCGHRYGPNHPEMERKLTEMDQMIDNIVNLMDNNTIIFVIGDHGMTESGDHGGDSLNEVTAALFIYSSYDLYPQSQVSSIHQIDLLPTLSTILGIPIPFSNLGLLYAESLPLYFSKSNQVCTFYRNNINQITNYIKEYQSLNNYFDNNIYQSIIKKYFDLKNIKCINKEFIIEHQNYLKAVQVLCKNVWTQFNYISMILSLLLFFIYLILLLLIYFQFINFQTLNFFNVISYFLVSLSLFVLIFFSNLSDKKFYSYFFQSSSVLLIIISLLDFKNPVKTVLYYFSYWNVLSLVVFLCSFLGILSNSFIVEENKVITFLLITLLILTFFQIVHYKIINKKNNEHTSSTLFITLVLTSVSITVRSLSNFWQCYDDQSSDCLSSKSPSLFFSVSVNLSVLFVYLSISYLLYKFYYFHFSLIEILLIFLSCIFRLNNILRSSDIDWLFNLLPQLVCFISIGLIIYCFIDPYKSSVFINKRGFWVQFLLMFIKISFVLGIFLLNIMNEQKVLSSCTLFISLYLLLILLSNLRKYNPSKNYFWDISVWYVSNYVHFYGTGHQPTFSSLQWDAVGPFTGLPIFIPGFLIVMNTYFSYVVHSFILPLIIIFPNVVSKSKFQFNYTDLKHFRDSTFSIIIIYIFLQGCRTFTSMLSATIHSRHLMVWKIFAPKFIFESLGFIISLIFLFLSFIFVERVSASYLKRNRTD